ncbi:HAD domain-containing protein [Streptomyces sp. NPDC051218]|uniref:HAD domain-containing protein n=1 Tax=Streptomyces sp. NPDC051218 TaxID=3365645 RepID=UPI0037A16CEC
MSAAVPLLFLDVDGPLLPFGATRQQLPNGYPTYGTGGKPSEADANPLITRIDPAHGPRLLALPCELVWATTWMADANECVAPWLGLPELPLLLWPDSPEESDESEEDERRGLHWKTRPVVRWAAGRAFAWVDDEITDADRFWVEAHHSGSALLLRVDPTRGMTDEDFGVLGRWLRGHSGVR